MQKNSPDFSLEEVLRLAKSPAGQQLIAMLREADPDQISQVMAQANSGAYTEAGKTLEQMLSSPEAKALLNDLGR